MLMRGQSRTTGHQKGAGGLCKTYLGPGSTTLDPVACANHVTMHPDSCESPGHGGDCPAWSGRTCPHRSARLGLTSCALALQSECCMTSCSSLPGEAVAVVRGAAETDYDTDQRGLADQAWT